MKIFLSSTEDLEKLANGFAADLHHAGIETILAEPNATYGLDKADAFVFFVGLNRSEKVERQWSTAVQEQWSHPEKRFIPVTLAPSSLPAFLQDREPILISSSGEDSNLSQYVLSALRGETSTGQPLTGSREKVQQDRLKTQEKDANVLQPASEELERKAKVLQAALETHLKTANADEIAKTATKLADVMKMLEKPADALQYQEAALSALERKPGVENDLAIARMHSNMASTLKKLNKSEAALKHLELAGQFYRDKQSDTLAHAASEMSLATMLKELGRAAEAKTHSDAGAQALANAAYNFFTTLPLVGTVIKTLADGMAAQRNARKNTAPSPVTVASEQAGTEVRKQAAPGKASGRKVATATTRAKGKSPVLLKKPAKPPVKLQPRKKSAPRGSKSRRKST